MNPSPKSGAVEFGPSPPALQLPAEAHDTEVIADIRCLRYIVPGT
jgi:hypothetical protein